VGYVILPPEALPPALIHHTCRVLARAFGNLTLPGLQGSKRSLLQMQTVAQVPSATTGAGMQRPVCLWQLLPCMQI
jgi:hypothetical protein